MQKPSRVAPAALATLAFLALSIPMPRNASAATLPTCAQLSTDRAYGLVKNPLVRAVSSTQVPATEDTPTYCQVDIAYSSGESGPTHGYATGESQAINIRVMLPERSEWNRNLISTTGGGSQGVLATSWCGDFGGREGLAARSSPAAAAPRFGQNFGWAVERHYMSVTTDAGHLDHDLDFRGLADFGMVQATHTLDLGKIKDWVPRSSHYATLLAKKIALVYYGAAVRRHYWNGESGGGHQGLSQLQNYANDYDGMLICRPANYWERFRLGDAWPALIAKTLAQQGKTLSATQVAAANAGAIAACDAMDGLTDGIVNDPRACTWSAVHNICGAAGAPAAPNCLDKDQANAIDRIWDGPRTATGERIWFGWPRGATFKTSPEVMGSGGAPQVVRWDHKDLTFDPNLLFADAASLAAAGNPAGGITYEDEAKLAEQVARYTDMDDAALDAAHQHGVKVIHMQDTCDALHRPFHSLDYYRRVATHFGGGDADFSTLQSWYRLFFVPNCGAGLPQADYFAALVNWVEKGSAPDQIIGSRGEHTRPLCPYPMTAIYNGSGSTDVAGSFHCGGNLETEAVIRDTQLGAKNSGNRQPERQ